MLDIGIPSCLTVPFMFALRQVTPLPNITVYYSVYRYLSHVQVGREGGGVAAVAKTGHGGVTIIPAALIRVVQAFSQSKRGRRGR